MIWPLTLLAWAEPAAEPKSWAVPPRQIAGRIDSSDYPREALWDGSEGRVEAYLIIDATGIVSSCTIKRSSGNNLLDAQTCKLVLARYRFDPARNTEGLPISVHAVLPVEWKLWQAPTDQPKGQ